MSLADELLADLEEIDDDGGAGDGDMETEGMEVDSIKNVDNSGGQAALLGQGTIGVKTVAKLRDSERLKGVLDRMEEFLQNPRSRESVLGPVEMDPEYLLIVEANNLTVEIDNEIAIIHKYCRDHYCKRFPELESLVPGALDYLNTIYSLGNKLEASKIETLEFLPAATRMVVSVTASTTQGEILEQAEVDLLMEACEMATDLTDAKIKIFQYVESRMSFIAPNLSIIIGASTAAKIMGVAGGLTVLSKMPACNILLLGAQKKTLSGFSSTSTLPHTGFIYFSDLVQDVPPHLRRKAARLVSAKCCLAARIDSFHESLDATLGRKFLEEIEKKLDKMQEPPPVKEAKALPRPDDPVRQKRGGRRVRKMKEKFAVTEMRRQANRMKFGELGEDMYQSDIGYGLGTLGKDGSGKVRNATVDKKTQVSISKRLQRNLAAMGQTYGGRSTVRGQTTSVRTQISARSQVAGTASSVAFSAVDGLEIVNPHAAENRAQEANAKYFSNQSGFFNVAKRDKK
eukprot:Seg4521.3 transcript_id=Seg4521.3/GoldUCD/mRNA.D3Y31 product="U4/U6 small nuclear ribonucleoprotein Prp31" protein_id=Seg4521.3/GoldUCD/D3Y31